MMSMCEEEEEKEEEKEGDVGGWHVARKLRTRQRRVRGMAMVKRGRCAPWILS